MTVITGERIARGETSDILRASDGEREYALKVLHPHLAADPIVRSRFVREGESLASIDHPNIVRVLDLVEHEGSPAMVLELAEGGDLAHRTVQHSEVPELLRAMLVALREIHRRGIIHRDLRPSHVLFAADGTPKLADFGMASIRDLSGLTRSTVFTTRPHYVDPHGWGQRRATPAGDLYSLGAVMFEVITGSPPPSALFATDARAQRNAVEAVRAAYDGLVATIVVALLDEPGRRPRSADEVLAWLDHGELTSGRRLGECIHCGSPMPQEAPICLACGNAPPRIDVDPNGEYIVLKKISEAHEVLSPFLRKLRLLSAGTDPIPNLLTGDVRLYSRAERRAGLRLPVRVVENVASESVGPLIDLLQGGHPTQIHLTRHAMTTHSRFDRGPLITVAPGTQVPAATADALRALASHAGADANVRDSELRRECAYAIDVAVGRALRDGPVDVDIVDSIAATMFAAVDHLESAERYLATVDLPAAYGEYERASISGNDRGAVDRVSQVFASYADAERNAGRMRSAILDACRLLEAATGKDLRERIARADDALRST